MPLSGFRTHDHSVRGSEYSSCLRSHWRCDRHEGILTLQWLPWSTRNRLMLGPVDVGAMNLFEPERAAVSSLPVCSVNCMGTSWLVLNLSASCNISRAFIFTLRDEPNFCILCECLSSITHSGALHICHSSATSGASSESWLGHLLSWQDFRGFHRVPPA
jgi:hypothetical protein